MASTPEGRVKAAIKKRLKELGVWNFSPVSNGMGVHGIPDILCCWKGRFIGLEVKAPGKRANTSALQDRQIAAIRESGGVAVVIDDVDQLDEVLNAQDPAIQT
jgi:hypothetical protein